jgi:hypothetical protein
MSGRWTAEKEKELGTGTGFGKEDLVTASAEQDADRAFAIVEVSEMKAVSGAYGHAGGQQAVFYAV